MNKISFICMCASEAVHTSPNKDKFITAAILNGFTIQEATHLYECCMSIYRSK